MIPGQLLTVAAQEDLAFKGRNDAPQIIVEGEGIYQWEAAARGVNIAALGGGYWVRLFTGGGSSTPSLSTPNSFIVTGKTNISIALDWADVANATNYLVERSATGTGGWSQVYSGAISSYTDTSLTPSTTYYYRVKATAAGYLDSAYATLNDTTSSGAVTTLTEAILILADGQSNVVGRADADPTNQVVVPSGVYEYKPNSNTVQPLADPTGMSGDYSQATIRSLNPNLGKRLVELTGKPVIIVPVGKGNTPIDNFITTTSTEYTTALSRWNAAIAYCAANSITILNKIAVYLQGENDAGSLETDAYLAKQNTYVDQRTNAFGCECVFDIRIGYDPGFTAAANSEKIMKAKKLLNNSKDYYIVSTFSPATFTTGNGKMKSDNVHYTVIGLNQVADETATAINTWLTSNKKTALTEPVTNLQDPGGYFDDIYNFRTLKPGSNQSGYKELFERNNLTLLSGSPTYNGKFGLTIPGSTPLIPAAARDLTNTHDWTVEVTFQLDLTVGSGMILNGRASGNWQNDWLWITSSSAINVQGNSVSTTANTGANFNQPTNLALVYTFIDNTLKVYVNGALTNTITTWAFTSFKIDAIARGYQSVPSSEIFKGIIERVRIVKRALPTWEFDRSPNVNASTAIDWDFQLNGNLNETQGDVSAVYRNYANTANLTPTYDADGIVLDTTGYVLFGQQLLLANDFTIEWRCKITDTSATRYFFSGGSRPNSPNNSFGFYDALTLTTRYFQLNHPSGSAKWNLGASFDVTVFHTYKIVQNKAAGTLVLFVDGVSLGSKAVANNFTLSAVGGGNPQAQGTIGTVDYFKVKNSL